MGNEDFSTVRLYIKASIYKKWKEIAEKKDIPEDWIIQQGLLDILEKDFSKEDFDKKRYY